MSKLGGTSDQQISIDEQIDKNMQMKGLQNLAKICSICNDAVLEYKDGQYTRSGEPTEAALKVLVEKMDEYLGKTLRVRIVRTGKYFMVCASLFLLISSPWFF
jgi:magnesium-transporting ATPase (P-type)